MEYRDLMQVPRVCGTKRALDSPFSNGVGPYFRLWGVQDSRGSSDLRGRFIIFAVRLPYGLECQSTALYTGTVRAVEARPSPGTSQMWSGPTYML